MNTSDHEGKASAPQMPAAVLFDLGDTIVNIVSQDRKRGLAAVLKHGKDLPANRSGLNELIDRLAEYGRDLDGRFEYLCVKHNLEYRQLDFHRLLYGRFGIEFDTDEDHIEWEYWNASLELVLASGLQSALQACRDRGIRMAVISNTTFRGWILQRELERLGIMEYFEFVMASADFGIRKPDPLLYEIALKRLDLQPTEAWYIGNFVDVDCAGAASAGMVPVWYAAVDMNAGRFDAESEKLPQGSLVLSAWSDLPGLLP